MQGLAVSDEQRRQFLTLYHEVNQNEKTALLAYFTRAYAEMRIREVKPELFRIQFDKFLVLMAYQIGINPARVTEEIPDGIRNMFAERFQDEFGAFNVSELSLIFDPRFTRNYEVKKTFGNVSQEAIHETARAYGEYTMKLMSEGQRLLSPKAAEPDVGKKIYEIELFFCWATVYQSFCAFVKEERKEEFYHSYNLVYEFLEENRIFECSIQRKKAIYDQAEKEYKKILSRIESQGKTPKRFRGMNILLDNVREAIVKIKGAEKARIYISQQLACEYAFAELVKSGLNISGFYDLLNGLYPFSELGNLLKPDHYHILIYFTPKEVKTGKINNFQDE